MATLKSARAKLSASNIKTEAKKAPSRANRPIEVDRIVSLVGEVKGMCSGMGGEKRAAICAKLDEIATIAQGK